MVDKKIRLREKIINPVSRRRQKVDRRKRRLGSPTAREINIRKERSRRAIRSRRKRRRSRPSREASLISSGKSGIISRGGEVVLTAVSRTPTRQQVRPLPTPEVLKPTRELIVAPSVRAEIARTIPRRQETLPREGKVFTPGGLRRIEARTFARPVPTVAPAPPTDVLGRRAEIAFERFRKAEVAQRREPTVLGVVRSGATAAAAVGRGALVGGREVGRFVRERPLESALIAAALLTPIPEEIPLIGVIGARTLRAARTGAEIGLGASFIVGSGVKVRESPTPRLTTAEVLGEGATFGVGFKFLKAATQPRILKAAILGTASLATGTIIGGRSARVRAGRISRAETRKRAAGIRTPAQKREAETLFTRASRRERLAEIARSRPALDERDIPTGKVRFVTVGTGIDPITGKSGRIVLEKRGKTVLGRRIVFGREPITVIDVRPKAERVKSFERFFRSEGLITILKPSKVITKTTPSTPKPSVSSVREKGIGTLRFGRTLDVVSKDLRPSTLFTELIEPTTFVEKPPKGFRTARIRETLLERARTTRAELVAAREVAAARFKRTGIDVGTAVRLRLGLFSPLDVRPISALAAAVTQKPMVISAVAVTADTDIKSAIATDVRIDSIEDTAIIPAIDIAPEVITRGRRRGSTVAPTIISPILFIPTTPSIPTPTRPISRTPRPRPPFSPFPPPPFPPLKAPTRERARLTPGRAISFPSAFDVFLRRRGEFRIVGRSLTRPSAIGLGARRVKAGLGATFRLVPVAGRASKAKIGIPAGFGEEFRRFKKVKGAKVPIVDEFIQRRKFRLATIGERREIRRARRGGFF